MKLWGRYLIAAAVLVAAWKVAAMMTGGNILPAPEDVIPVFYHALQTPLFWEHFGASTFRATVAMILAWSVAFPLGLVMGGSRRADEILAPLVFLTYPIPKIVLLPVFLLLLGLGDASKISMIALILGYQVLVTTRDGVRSINRKYFDSVRSMGGTKWNLLVEVLVPAALPHGFTALRLNTGVAVAVLFLVESFATNTGLGYLIMDAWGALDYVTMFVGILGMSLLGVMLFEVVNQLERRMCRWMFS